MKDYIALFLFVILYTVQVISLKVVVCNLNEDLYITLFDCKFLAFFVQVILLECVPKESSIPQDVLSHFNTAFKYAKQGNASTEQEYSITAHAQ